MKVKEKKLGINAVLNSIRTIMTVIFPLITYPYVTRVLQPENIGKLNFASSFIGYFSLIAVLGITIYASREGVQYRDDREKFSRFASQIFTLNLITTVISYCLLTICILLIPKLHEYTVALVIYSFTIIFSTLGMEWIYNVYEDYVHITVRSIVMQAISMILLFVLVRDAKDLYIYASLNVLASVGGNIWNYFRAKKYFYYTISNKKEIFLHLKPSLIFFSSSLAASIYSNIDTTMLGFFKDDWTVGIYSAAVKFYGILKTLILAITNVAIPRLTYYKSQGDEEAFNKLLSKIIKIVVTLLIPMVIGLIIVSEDMVVVLCGEDYLASGRVLQLLSIAILVSIFATIVNGCILIPSRLEKIALRGTVTAAIVNAVLNLPMIPWLGEKGAAITTIIAEASVFIIGWWYARKLVKLEDMKKTVIISIVASLLMFIPSVIIANFVTNSALLRMCLTIGSCVVLYFIISLLCRNEVILEGLKIVKGKLRRNHEKD